MVKVISPVHDPNADLALLTTTSVVYDAIAVIGKQPWVDLPDAQDFVRDAFRHCKAIAMLGDAATLFDAWGMKDALKAPGVISGDQSKALTKDFIRAIAAHRHWEREKDPVTDKKGGALARPER